MEGSCSEELKTFVCEWDLRHCTDPLALPTGTLARSIILFLRFRGSSGMSMAAFLLDTAAEFTATEQRRPMKTENMGYFVHVDEGHWILYFFA